MMDHMKIHKITDCQPFPFLMVDNFFTEKQLEGIWKELNFYEGKTVLDTVNIAKNAGKDMAQVKRIYLEKTSPKKMRENASSKHLSKDTQPKKSFSRAPRATFQFLP